MLPCFLDKRTGARSPGLARLQKKQHAKKTACLLVREVHFNVSPFSMLQVVGFRPHTTSPHHKNNTSQFKVIIIHQLFRFYFFDFFFSFNKLRFSLFQCFSQILFVLHFKVFEYGTDCIFCLVRSPKYALF